MHQTSQIRLFEVCISSSMVLPEKPKVPGDSSEGSHQGSEGSMFFIFEYRRMQCKYCLYPSEADLGSALGLRSALCVPDTPAGKGAV